MILERKMCGPFVSDFGGSGGPPPLKVLLGGQRAHVKLTNLLGDSQLNQTSMIQKSNNMGYWQYLQRLHKNFIKQLDIVRHAEEGRRI